MKIIQFMTASSGRKLTNPLGREYEVVATAFLKSSQQVTDEFVKLFLIYHAIECALKAHLMYRTGDLGDLAQSHSINQLIKSASDLKLMPEDMDALQAFEVRPRKKTRHKRMPGKPPEPPSPSVAFRYFFLDMIKTASPDDLKQVAEKIIGQINLERSAGH